MDLLVKDTQICVEAFLQNTLFHAGTHLPKGMNRDHAHSVFQRDAGLKHGADQPVGGCNAAGKGLPVQQFGDTVLDDDRDRIIGTAGEALPDIKTGWTNGVCDQSDMLRLLELVISFRSDSGRWQPSAMISTSISSR